MSAWWFGVNNSRVRHGNEVPGHMHFRDIEPLLSEGVAITWPFGGAPGSMKLYRQMVPGDDVVLWMGDGVEPAWGILGLAKIDSVNQVAQELRLSRAGGPSAPLTPYVAGEAKDTTVTQALRRIFGVEYGPLRKLFSRLGAPVQQKVVTIDRVTEIQLAELRKLLAKVPSPPSERVVKLGALELPERVAKIVATTATFIQQRRPGFFFANMKEDRLWLHCGRIIPFSVSPSAIWLSVEEASLANATRLMSWSWDEQSEFKRYKRTPARNGYYDASRDPSGTEWRVEIAPAFFDYLEILCERGHSPDHRTKSTPGLCEAIASWGGEEADIANFEQRVRIARRSSPEARRARLERASPIPQVVTTVVKVFQRNPDVVAEVLARADGVCELCGLPAPFVRASDGTPYLEVHHRITLANGGHDTVKNAVAACPNCHRKKHFG